MTMLQSISDALPRFQTYESLFRDHPTLQQALCSMYLELISFLCKAKKVFGNKGRLRRMVLWRPFDEAFCTHIGQLIRYSELVEREAGVADMVEGSTARAEVKALMRVLIEDRQLRERGRRKIQSR